jgi:hypothetical protein
MVTHFCQLALEEQDIMKPFAYTRTTERAQPSRLLAATKQRNSLLAAQTF